MNVSDDVLIKVLKFLHPVDVDCCRLVNRRFHSIISKNANRIMKTPTFAKLGIGRRFEERRSLVTMKGSIIQNIPSSGAQYTYTRSCNRNIDDVKSWDTTLFSSWTHGKLKIHQFPELLRGIIIPDLNLHELGKQDLRTLVKEFEERDLRIQKLLWSFERQCFPNHLDLMSRLIKRTRGNVSILHLDGPKQFQEKYAEIGSSHFFSTETFKNVQRFLSVYVRCEELYISLQVKALLIISPFKLNGLNDEFVKNTRLRSLHPICQQHNISLEAIFDVLKEWCIGERRIQLWEIGKYAMRTTISEADILELRRTGRMAKKILSEFEEYTIKVAEYQVSYETKNMTAEYRYKSVKSEMLVLGFHIDYSGSTSFKVTLTSD